MAELKNGRYTVGTVSLYVATCGDGPALLMLPSVTMTHDNWSILRPHLEPRLRLIMPDPIGSGRSDKPDRRAELYTASGQADLMLGLLDAMGIREAHVIGAAFGGATALAMAGKARTRIRSAVVIEGLFAEPRLPLWAARMRDTLSDLLAGRVAFGSMKRYAVAEGLAKAAMRERWDALPRDRKRTLADAYFDPEADRQGWIAQLKGAGRDVSPLLADLTTPILYLRGERSTAAAHLERGIAFLKTLPRALVVTVEGGAHDLHIQSPEKVAEHALAFWRGAGLQV